MANEPNENNGQGPEEGSIGVPAPEGPANLIDTDYASGRTMSLPGSSG
ncbi:MAG: hypothetical protein U5L11_15740 [Arhodomonas sp.]|nr:hypothetical protein [Arhodomonas sp.]